MFTTKPPAPPKSVPVEIPKSPSLFEEEIPGSPDRLSISPYLVGSGDAQYRLTSLLQQFKNTPPSVFHPDEDTQGQKSVAVSPPRP